ncbi:MAG: hypothetical protein LBK25_07110 [Treponema sp.]|nr:hypothetical protein [Treponema sp.]
MSDTALPSNQASPWCQTPTCRVIKPCRGVRDTAPSSNQASPWCLRYRYCRAIKPCRGVRYRPAEQPSPIVVSDTPPLPSNQALSWCQTHRPAAQPSPIVVSDTALPSNQAPPWCQTPPYRATKLYRGVRHHQRQGWGGRWRKTALARSGDRGAHHKGTCVPSSV